MANAETRKTKRRFWVLLPKVLKYREKCWANGEEGLRWRRPVSTLRKIKSGFGWSEFFEIVESKVIDFIIYLNQSRHKLFIKYNKLLLFLWHLHYFVFDFVDFEWPDSTDVTKTWDLWFSIDIWKDSPGRKLVGQGKDNIIQSCDQHNVFTCIHQIKKGHIDII